METKANYLMIGGFVLGVLAFAFIFVFWMSNFAGGGKHYKIVFESSVAGLTSGSQLPATQRRKRRRAGRRRPRSERTPRDSWKRRGSWRNATSTSVGNGPGWCAGSTTNS